MRLFYHPPTETRHNVDNEKERYFVLTRAGNVAAELPDNRGPVLEVAPAAAATGEGFRDPKIPIEPIPRPPALDLLCCDDTGEELLDEFFEPNMRPSWLFVSDRVGEAFLEPKPPPPPPDFRRFCCRWFS